VAFAWGDIKTSEGLAIISGQRYLEIVAPYVHPDHRTRGVGGQLVYRLLAAATVAGVTRAPAQTATVDSQRSVGCYRERGFTVWYVELSVRRRPAAQRQARV
jgi:GNAT superfamily N-acetyltransferase